MIISVRQFDYDTLKSKLNPEDKIIVVSCNNCAKKCKGLGGRPGLAALADKLEADGFNVLRRELIGIACSVDLNAKRTKEDVTKKLFEQATVIIPLSCEEGEAAAEMAYPNAKVMKVTKTVGCGWGSPSVGVRVTTPAAGLGLSIDSPEGITIDDAAQQLGLFAGGF